MAETNARESGTPTPETEAEVAKVEEAIVLGDCVTADFARNLERERDAARAALRWIPVAERLPDGKRWVLAADADGERRTCLFVAGSFCGHLVYPVSHWQELAPLPTAPQDEGGGK